jgi:hypothetical protein
MGLSHIMTGDCRLSAQPSLISEGEYTGELERVAFVATSATSSKQWFVINCGQFERAFGKLLPHKAATEMVAALTRGEGVEFPGRYRPEEFRDGFHYKWFPVFSDLPRSIHRG